MSGYRWFDDDEETGMSSFVPMEPGDVADDGVNPVALFAGQSASDYPGPAAIKIRYEDGEPVFDGFVEDYR